MAKNVCNIKENHMDPVVNMYDIIKKLKPTVKVSSEYKKYKIYLGDEYSSDDYYNLKKNNIKYVIKVMPEFKNKYDDIHYLYIPVKDEQLKDKNLSVLFNKTRNFINVALTNNSSILIHCKRGHHRSAAVVMDYLVNYCGYNYNKCKSHIRTLRPCSLRRQTNITDYVNKNKI